jgi:tetratricopeptide (TPR) repeat protein
MKFPRLVLLALAITVAMLLPRAAVHADIIHLKDGRRIEGAIKRTPEGWTITAGDGTVLTVSAKDVTKVELSGDGSAAVNASAADKLASLRRAVEPMASIDEIIARYERFITANAGTPAADDAKREITLWQKRKAEGYVKLGSRWVLPAERGKMLAEINRLVDQAVAFVKANQTRDAEPIIAQLLEIDPKNISALYLQGLMLYAQDQIVPARKAFESVNAQIADHAPTLNNLGAIAYRQNQFGAALNFYDQAMAAAPLDRVIIDNVAEAMNALKDDQRRVPIVGRVAKHYAEQEDALAAQLARQNLFRWGATWVDRKQFDQLQAEEKRIEERVRQLEQSRTERERDVAIIEDRMIATDRSLRRMEADRYAYSMDGQLIVLPLPPSYYEMQRDLEVLRGERVRAIAAVEQVKKEIEQARQDLPVPRYTGVQKLIGADGTPIEDDGVPRQNVPATTPSTQPAPPARRNL